MNESRIRNKPCPCGSGKKFKRCCWEAKKLVPSLIPPKEPAAVEAANPDQRVIARRRHGMMPLLAATLALASFDNSRFK